MQPRRPSLEAAKHCLWSGSILLAYMNFFAKYNDSKNIYRKPLKLDMDLSKW